MIPYGRQFIDKDDIEAVVSVLKSDWLTTGPKVEAFEAAVAEYVGAKYAVAVSSGTAALHCAMFALGINQHDEVIVPPMSFAATANCVVYQGGTPVFSDIQPDTLLIDPQKIAEKITTKTRAIIAVDYAGQPCDYDKIKKIAKKYQLKVVSDSCHALGAEYKGEKVGSIADLTVFSFHPVKPITTGEGGLIVTNNQEYADRMRNFRNHGINSDFKQREQKDSWFYEMVSLGYNYRLTDIQCALGLSQLDKLDMFIERRRKIAGVYDETFADNRNVTPLYSNANIRHAYHLYVVKIAFDQLALQRRNLFKKFREKGIGVNVHYIPIHLHPFYKKKFNTYHGLCPVGERVYHQILSLPIHPILTENEVRYIIDTIENETAG